MILIVLRYWNMSKNIHVCMIFDFQNLTYCNANTTMLIVNGFKYTFKLTASLLSQAFIYMKKYGKQIKSLAIFRFFVCSPLNVLLHVYIVTDNISFLSSSTDISNMPLFFFKKCWQKQITQKSFFLNLIWLWRLTFKYVGKLSSNYGPCDLKKIFWQIVKTILRI